MNIQAVEPRLQLGLVFLTTTGPHFSPLLCSHSTESGLFLTDGRVPKLGHDQHVALLKMFQMMSGTYLGHVGEQQNPWSIQGVASNTEWPRPYD